MAFFTWTESMSIGVEEFDAHHKKLIDFINTLFDAMSVGKGKDVLEKILLDLMEYTKYHFQAEEARMKEYGYPGYVSHQAEHQKLLKEVADFYRKFQSGDVFVSLDVLNFLKEWINKHILQTDKMYKPFFNNKGVK